MSRYMNNDTSNCTEIWAGTAFYQDCFDQTVCLGQTDGEILINIIGIF